MARAHGVERAPDIGTAEAHVARLRRARRPSPTFDQAARCERAVLGSGSALARIPTFADLALDVLLAERLLGVEPVVGAAADAPVWELARAAASACEDVIELEQRRGLAAMPFGIDEGAAFTVPLEDRAPRGARRARGVASLP
jgi:hypothetical protein